MKRLALALLLPCSLLTAGTPDKNAKDVILAPAEAWGYPLLGGGVKSSDVYIEGSFFLTLPLHSSIGLDGTLGGDYIFVEPYTSWGEQGEVASSLGFGWRHLFNQQPVGKLKDSAPAGFLDEGWHLGASLFVDRLDTQFDNVFWQMGVGAEIGTRYVELRGNYYIPFNGDKKLAFKDVQRQTITSTSTELVQSGGGAAGTTFAAGNSVFQNTGGTVTEVKSTSTTTLTRTTSIFEEGMEGWDAELGHRQCGRLEGRARSAPGARRGAPCDVV
jgi:Inverse autotransporter, beta-domain